MKSRLVATTLLTACGIVQAASPSEPVAPPDKQPAATANKKTELKAKQPMKVPMAREGMMMGDVKEAAAKKDAAMKEMMQQEQMKLPAPPK